MLAIGFCDTSRQRDLRGAPLYGTMMRLAVHRLFGPVAQLGARLHGMQKVRGSNPLRSTLLVLRGLAFHPARAKGFFVYVRL